MSRKTQRDDDEIRDDDDDADADDDARDDDDRDDDEDDDEDVGDDSHGGGPQAEEQVRRRRLRIIAWVVVAAILIGVVVYMRMKPPARAPAAGNGTADITLVTADRKDLDCMAPKDVSGFQCGYSDEHTERKVDEAHQLRPFLTLDRELYLIPGLFLEPAIEKRFNEEPPNKPRDQLKRFTAKCKIEVVGEMPNVSLRWSPSATWEPPITARVATISNCTIDG